MKELLLKNWTLWRIVRLVLAVVFIVNGIIKADTILLVGGGFLLMHALLNACVSCAEGSCEIPKK